jgi:hypothetical protein
LAEVIGIEPIQSFDFIQVCRLLDLGHGATLELGFEPRLSVLETDALTVDAIPAWWQWWELHPHHPSYELGALLLSYTATFGV